MNKLEGVTSPSASEQVMARTLAIVSVGSGGFAGACVLSLSNRRAFFGIMLLPTLDCRTACAGAPGDFENGSPVSGVENKTCPLNMFKRAAAVMDDRREALAVVGVHSVHTASSEKRRGNQWQCLWLLEWVNNKKPV